MQVIQYEKKNDIVLVGFKKGKAAVYTKVFVTNRIGKDEILQLAYIKVKPALEYESTLDNPSIQVDVEGEDFTPDSPRPASMNVDFDTLTGEVLSQYGEVYSTDIKFSIEGTKSAYIEDSVLVENDVNERVEYFLVAKSEGFTKKQFKIIYPRENPVEDEVEDEIITLRNELFDGQVALQLELEGEIASQNALQEEESGLLQSALLETMTAQSARDMELEEAIMQLTMMMGGK